jgi:L-xylulokinase
MEKPFPHSLASLNARWSPYGATFARTIRQVLSLAAITGDRVRGVSFSSHGKGLYAIDKKGEPVRNGIVSSDTRAGAMVVELQQQGIEAVTYPRSLQTHLETAIRQCCYVG